jgi:hypothetical protein
MERTASLTSDLQSYLTVRVDPDDMVQYVVDLMAAPRSAVIPDTSLAVAQAQWGGNPVLARAAQLRWNALNRAFSDVRVSTWTTPQRRDQIHVPAALIAAAGVARLTVAEDEVVFDIPTLLDATLQMCEAGGHG